MARQSKPKTPLSVEALRHDEAKRKNIPTAEYQSVLEKSEQTPIRIAYERRNRDLDPQLVWRGKDQQDWSDLVVHAPPLYIQEKVHPKVLIDDLRRETEHKREADAKQQAGATVDLFADFNGLPGEAARTEFYQHDAHWANRMILGDSLQVMASLAEREGLRGKVQCIYLDPPYGIKFNSNFQWSTTSRDVKDGQADHITREPEQVKAFRDTWRDGIHSYLTYLRDRLTVARDLLTDSGSIFVQIGDENVHRVRAVMDEVFGDGNFVQQIIFRTSAPLGSDGLQAPVDYIIWFSKHKAGMKYRALLEEKEKGKGTNYMWTGSFEQRRRLSSEEVAESAVLPKDLFYPSDFASSGYTATCFYNFELWGRNVQAGKKSWRTNVVGTERLIKASRLMPLGNNDRPCFIQYHTDNPTQQIKNTWFDTRSAMDKIYVVQTQDEVVKRCVLMSTDPGDLVLDPTCGSGTAAYVAEQWGRRWITIDTSRVALALARARIMGARYPFYLLADSRDGQAKEADITRSVISSRAVHGDIRQGFVLDRIPHVTLGDIANNAEIDVIWDKYQQMLEPLRAALNKALGKQWQEWEIPRENGSQWEAKNKALYYSIVSDWDLGRKAEAKDSLAILNRNLGKHFTLDKLPLGPFDPWPEEAEKAHKEWWQQRIARQKEIDASIAAKAESEYLYDKPYEDKKKVRVAGPFTVESLSPHRVLGVDENDEIIDGVREPSFGYGERDFATIILENLKTAGVQQAHKADKIDFTALAPWPGSYVCAEGRYIEGKLEKRAGIFIGPEFGTVSRPDLVSAAREAADADFDVLIACAFNYDALSSEFDKLGRIPVLKARMNADLHMAEDLKNTGKGNLFVIFGEPDIEILDQDKPQIRVQVKGVDVFKPNEGKVESSGTDGIACWFIDTDYNEESFFVRQAYFLGANDPYKSLKTTLKAEIDADAWESLHSDTSRPFDKPKSGRIAVKVINHLGDEVMKVFKVS
jgi:adenine-specific DNA-methyltransferase